jgi:hypothetical protein
LDSPNYRLNGDEGVSLLLFFAFDFSQALTNALFDAFVRGPVVSTVAKIVG